MSLPERITFVVAGNAQQFEYYCRTNELNPRAPDIIYVKHLESLKGYKADKMRILLVGHCFDRIDVWEIMAEVRMYEALGATVERA